MLVMRELSDFSVLPKSERETITRDEKQETRAEIKLSANQLKAAQSFNREMKQLTKLGWSGRVWVDGKGQLRALPTKAIAPYPLPAGWKTVNQAPTEFAQATADFQRSHRLLAEGQLNAETWKQLVKEIDAIMAKAAKAASDAFPNQRNQREDPPATDLTHGEAKIVADSNKVMPFVPFVPKGDDLVKTPAAAAQQLGVDARRPGESINDWAVRNHISLPATFPKDRTPTAATSSKGGDPTIKQQQDQKLQMLLKAAEASSVKVAKGTPSTLPPADTEADPSLLIKAVQDQMAAQIKPWYKRWQILVPTIGGVGLVSGLGVWLMLRRR